MSKQTQTPGVLPADSPVGLLEQLEMAYNIQDIDLYRSCLHPDFQFYLVSSDVPEIGVDMDGDGFKDNWWGINEEIEYHSRLFNRNLTDQYIPSPASITLSLQVPPESIWQQNTEEGFEHVLIIPCWFDLHLVYDNQADIQAKGYARFHVIGEDGRWTILRWYDESSI